MSKNLIICFHKITFTALTVSVPHYIFYLQNYIIHLINARIAYFCYENVYMRRNNPVLSPFLIYNQSINHISDK